MHILNESASIKKITQLPLVFHLTLKRILNNTTQKYKYSSRIDIAIQIK